MALTGNGVGTCGPDDNQAQAGHLVVQPLASRGRDEGTQIEVGPEGGPDNALRSGAGSSSRAVVFVKAQKAHDPEDVERWEPSDHVNTLDASGHTARTATAVLGAIAHALTSEGADASEDGTGRGTPVIAFGPSNGLDEQASESVYPTVRAGHGTVPAVVTPLDLRNALRADGATGVGTPGTGIGEEGDPAGTVSTGALGGVATAGEVRRLTPLECERLQGFPDNWTATSDGRAQADSARYRQMGNAVAVPVVEWIARRIVAVDTAQAVT
jgi:site-specific DNA-cytosine methylase